MPSEKKGEARILAYETTFEIPLWAIVAAGVAVVGAIVMVLHLLRPDRR
jgi:hypothetical protein